MLAGYARISTNDQNLDLQLDALTKAGCETIFNYLFRNVHLRQLTRTSDFKRQLVKIISEGSNKKKTRADRLLH